jgi:hypothetical protein
MNLTKLRAVKEPPPPPLESGERLALAAAIEHRNAVQRELDATLRALDELQESRFAGGARKAVEAAREAVETAKANAAAFVTATILGTAGEPPMTVKEARAALEEAEDNLETQRTVEAGLKAKKEAEEQALYFAKSRVKDKIQSVVGADPSLRKLLVEFEEMRRAVAQRERLLGSLSLMIPHEFRFWQGTRQYRDNELQDETPPWRAALAELEHDSDAALPTV